MNLKKQLNNNMPIAQNKLQENIAEYILYVWQMQDLLRSVSLDTDVLYQKLGLTDSNDPNSEERNWLKNLAERIKIEAISKKGNTAEISTILAELHFLHNTLIEVLKDDKYVDIYAKSAPHIKGLMAKSTSNQNIMEHMLIALYGWLILRMQKKDISQETVEAMASFSKTMAYVSLKYKEMKTGEINPGFN
tara:strand:+ start:12778 stop:13350 length:573 start_codon:yes stop_codon:yes gene_type:complete